MTLHWLISNLLFVISLISYLFFKNKVNQLKREIDKKRLKLWVNLTRVALWMWVIWLIVMIYTLIQ